MTEYDSEDYEGGHRILSGSQDGLGDADSLIAVWLFYVLSIRILFGFGMFPVGIETPAVSWMSRRDKEGEMNE